MDIDAAEALWALGMLPGERLPDVAVAALEAGLDNDPLRMLAGLTSLELDQAESLFEQALKELGRGQLGDRDAVRLYARSVSGQILRKEIEPYVGAKKIWQAARKVSAADFHDVDPFIYAASEYEERPEDREFFNREIRKEAQRWVVIEGGSATRSS